jgi:threonylcarbamoyladenosine tRNA methylthiotransferase MtaB
MIFHISTLGCKVNQHESDILATALNTRGWQAVADGQVADVCIVNTCTVTQKASMQSRQMIRQLQRRHPGAVVIVTGCYAQIAPEEIESIDGVHAIVGHRRKSALPDLIIQAARNADAGPLFSVEKLDATIPFADPPVTAPGRRTRPFLKIQDGCNSFCTYCIVPYARGRSRSMRPERVLHHLNHLGGMGYHEVVLTGIHLGAYGMDLSPPTHLLDLLELIETHRPMARIRLSSIEPHEVSRDIIEQVASSAIFCPHFHLPLQSGDDTILKRMHRPYTRDLFRQQVLTIHSRMPQAAVGVDVLVGFPGEDERAFDNTARLLEELPLSYLHVFPFSRRPGTPACNYPDQVDTKIIKQRTARLRAIGREKKQAFLKRAVGRKADVLVESRRDAATGHLIGLTGNYRRVLMEGPDRHMNSIVPTHIESVHSKVGLWGRIVQ